MKYRLQPLIFCKSIDMKRHWGMYYQKHELIYSPDEKAYMAADGRSFDFLTYFNSFSMKKWKEYTGIRTVSIVLKIRGVFQINLIGGFCKNGSRSSLMGKKYNLDKPTEIELKFDENDCDVLGFEILARRDCYIYEGCYCAEISEEALRPVELSIATVTFKKEDFIIPNLKLLQEKLLDSDEDLAKHLTIHVIDNGRTLNAAELETEKIHIHPNINAGGSGGYARGMIEAVTYSVKPTHVLLMDDDIIVFPESILRLYTLLRLLKPEYQDHFVSGAMLFYEERNIQHEDVGNLRADGSYGPVKSQKYMDNWHDVVSNEEIIKPAKNQYAGWWFCCIPASTVRLDNLPLPLFIRGDDVEYSIRNHAKFITMNGICVWHMGFVQKFNQALELYQVHRNSMIIQAASGVGSKIDFIKRIRQFFRREIFRFNYDGAELLLEAVDDYMKGYKFLLKPRGEQIMKEKGALNEQLVPLSKYPGILVEENKLFEKTERNVLEKLFFRTTFNGHLLPNCFLRREPSVIAYGWFYSPKKYSRRRRLLAVNPYNNTAHMREIDRKAFWKLIFHYIRTMNNYKKNHEKVEKEYRNHRAYLTSYEFWEKYLGLK